MAATPGSCCLQLCSATTSGITRNQLALSCKTGQYHCELFKVPMQVRHVKVAFLDQSFVDSMCYSTRRGLVVRAVVDGRDAGNDEEARWLREERRWLREEERWLREEARWNAEREVLLQQSITLKEEIKALKEEIAKLRILVKDEKIEDGVISDLIGNLTSLLQTLSTTSPSGNGRSAPQIPSTTSSAVDIKATFGSIPLDSKIPTPNVGVGLGSPANQYSKSVDGPASIPIPSVRGKRALKRGSEGEDVKAMQEALESLGFYSGEEDMEYSTFSTGTERAVRTWQATLGIPEDGIVTTDLLTRLLEKESANVVQIKVKPSTSTKELSGAVPASKGNVSNVPMGSPEKTTGTSVGASHTRVYLLGENRWEEPSRLLVKTGSATLLQGEKCFSCKGQGTTMCTECEGTGELNVEEQFLEWAGEGANCPYCEGQGVIDCDVCNGNGLRVV